jgi:hypothetical protein
MIDFIKTDPIVYKAMFVTKEAEMLDHLDRLIKQRNIITVAVKRQLYGYDGETTLLLLDAWIQKYRIEVERFQKLQKLCDRSLRVSETDTFERELAIAKEKTTREVLSHYCIESKAKNILCPFHNEKTPSMYVYEYNFHCFGCGIHLDCIGFVQKHEGVGFVKAVQILNKL